MDIVTGKTAFVTGGASGIGLGIARAFASNGMNVVIADSRQDALDEAMVYFKRADLTVHPLKLDVTDRPAYIKAADETEALFGKIHVLVNNAGVATGGPLQFATFKDWDFALGVNISGVVNGLVIILPRILKHGEEGHVVSTSSTAGITAVGMNGIYNTTKYAIAGMMETLATDLQGTKVGASLFCPGPVSTNLGKSTQANRPEHLKNDGVPAWRPPPPSPGAGNRPPWDTSLFMTPEEVGERVLRGILRNDLFIFTHPEFKDGVRARNEALIRAFPDEPDNQKRHEMLAKLGTLIFNPIYQKQTTPGPLNWNKP